MSGAEERPAGRARIPADVDRPDAILGGLTARQLVILAATGVVLWLAYAATRQFLPLPAFAALAAPVALSGAALALGRAEGVPLDRLLAAAWSQARRPRRLVLAPAGVVPPPSWAGTSGPVPSPLRLPVAWVGGDGVIDLGPEGTAILCKASAVTFSLRTPAEQGAMVAGFARFLHSLSDPVQVLIRATPVDLGPAIEELLEAAPALPHPGLEQACRDHARFLAELNDAGGLLSREVLLVLRQPGLPGGQADTAGRLRRRAEGARAALAGAGVVLRILEGSEASACMAACLDPGAPSQPAELAPPGAVITGPEVEW